MKLSLLNMSVLLTLSFSPMAFAASSDAQIESINTRIKIYQSSIEKMEKSKQDQIANYQAKINEATNPAVKKVYQDALSKAQANDPAKSSREKIAELEAKKQFLLTGSTEVAKKPATPEQPQTVTPKETVTSDIQKKETEVSNFKEAVESADTITSKDATTAVIRAILKDLQGVEQEESIKSITYVGSKKISKDYMYATGDEKYPFWGRNADTAVYTFKVEPMGDISVLRNGGRTCVIKDDIRKECTLMDGKTRVCKSWVEIPLCKSSEYLKEQESPKLTRVAIHQIEASKLGSFNIKKTGGFKSLTLQNEEMVDNQKVKTFKVVFENCSRVYRIAPPKKSHYYDDPFFYTINTPKESISSDTCSSKHQ